MDIVTAELVFQELKRQTIPNSYRFYMNQHLIKTAQWLAREHGKQSQPT